MCSNPFLQLSITISLILSLNLSIFPSPESFFFFQHLNRSTVGCQQGQHQSVAKQFLSLRSGAWPHARLEQPKVAFAGFPWFCLQPEQH